MRSCLVMGSGRSGTSMLAGTLAKSGAFMGRELWPARAANPKGFFEGPEINGLNEELLAPLVAPSERLGENQRWLAALSLDAPIAHDPRFDARMAALVAQRPYCYKDPRFCYTLPAWRPHLGDAAFLTVFRHPTLTAASIVEEVRAAKYLHGVEMSLERAMGIWCATYRHVLRRHRHTGDWLFLHFDQVLTSAGLDKIEALVEARVDRGFPDETLARPPLPIPMPDEAVALYEELCELARYRPAGAAAGAVRAAPAPAQAEVAVVVSIGDADRVHLAALRDDLRAQRGANARLVVLDRTTAGLALDDATIVRADAPTPSASWRRAFAAATTPYVALHQPGVRMLANRLRHVARHLDAHPEHQGVRGELVTVDADGNFAPQRDPGSYTLATLAFRRTAIDALDDAAAEPLRALVRAVPMGRVPEPVVAVPLAEWLRQRDEVVRRARVFVRADWSRPDAVPRLLARTAPMVDTHTALVLLHGANEPGPDTGALATHFEALHGAERTLDVEIEVADAGASASTVLGAPSDAVLILDEAAAAAAPSPAVAGLPMLRDIASWANRGRTATLAVSVVVPAFNRLDLLRPVLDGFAEQTHADFEVVVVDDGSSPAIDLRAHFDARFRWIRQDNEGRAGAVDTGIDAARGALVIVCDSDIVPGPSFVAEHVAFHAAHPHEGATHLGDLEWGVDAGVLGEILGARANPRMTGLTGPVDWTQWYTDNWSVKRALLERYDLRFDRGYRGWGWEDLDLTLRLARAGVTCTATGTARGRHLKPVTLDGMLRNFAGSVPNLLRLAANGGLVPAMRDWLAMRIDDAEVREACDRLASGALATLLASWRAVPIGARPDVQVDVSNAIFRLGLTRGFAALPAAAQTGLPPVDPAEAALGFAEVVGAAIGVALVAGDAQAAEAHIQRVAAELGGFDAGRLAATFLERVELRLRALRDR